MAVPDYQSFMTPILEVSADGEDYRTRELKELVADRLDLSHEDRSEMLPSGNQATYDNRFGWAKTYLVKAGLLESPERGWVRITERGRAALDSGQDIDNRYLRQFDDFEKFRGRSASDKTEESTARAGEDEDVTPDERLDMLYRSIRKSLALELLDTVRAASPAFFERLVVELLVAMGYGGSIKDAGNAIGKSSDQGIDGIIKQDRLGLDNVYVQAKRWAEGNNVGSREVRDLAGALQMRRAVKGVLITTSDFSSEARGTAEQIGNIVLVSGEDLAELMIEHGVGVSTTGRYELKRIDQDYFDEG